jgi:pyruvate ferredoxin oxidoreductase alpha subunit
MQEPLFWASGLRLPIVMAVTNRSLLAPNTIFCDHQDSLSQRDSGWIQIYAQSCQEALDLIPIAYRVSEHSDVLLPVMVCLDGFFLSHLREPVEIPNPQDIDRFLPARTKNYPQLDPEHPMMLNVLVPPDYYAEFEYDKQVSMQLAHSALEASFADFEVITGRGYAALETYRIKGADCILVAMGSMVGTIKEKVRELRESGEAVGLIGLRIFRPFPVKELALLLKGASKVGVLDRSVSFGSSGPLFLEVLRALACFDKRPVVKNFIVGLGGRDVNLETISEAFRQLSHSGNHTIGEQDTVWLDLDKALCRSWGLD